MIRKILWILFVVLAMLIGLYPALYFFVDRQFGLLSSKSAELLANIFWNTAFYTHIILGGIALFIGWSQFSTRIRTGNIKLHRGLGKTYVIAVTLSSVAAIYIGFFASGGIISSSGFICLGIIWLSTTLSAYTNIRKGMILQHQVMMTYSYAACFAAVTLRIWLPLLTSWFGDFIPAYRIVAWLCWVPNLVVAYFITRRLDRSKQKISPLTLS